jgi:hypothetical protein
MGPTGLLQAGPWPSRRARRRLQAAKQARRHNVAAHPEVIMDQGQLASQTSGNYENCYLYEKKMGRKKNW